MGSFIKCISACSIMALTSFAHSAVIYTQDFQNGDKAGVVYMGSKVNLVSSGFDGNNYSIETTLDGSGHAPYVTTIKIPKGYDTIYVRFYHKVNPASTYEAYRTKRLKLRAWSADQNCYWNITFHANGAGYGGTDGCENDTQHYVYQSDKAPSARTGESVVFNKVPSSPFSYKDNQWYCFEYKVSANTDGQPGNIEEWVDGQLFWSLGGMHLRPTGNNWTISQIDFEGYTTGTPAPKIANSWIDNIEVSNQRIGCAGTTSPTNPTNPPNPPSNIN